MSILELLLVVATLYGLVMVGLIIWHTRRTSLGGRSFAWYILWTTLWMVCAIIIIHASTSRATALWAVRATFFCGSMLSICWIWFCANFPLPDKKFRKVALALILLDLPWLAITWSPWFITGFSGRPWGENVEFTQSLVGVYTVWMQIFGAIGAIHLLSKVKHVRGLERMQVRYILLGYVGLVVIGGLTNLILPALTGSTKYAPLGPLSSLFVATTTTYAIVRYRLMDIRLVLRAGIVYSITIGTLSLLFALLVPTLDMVLQQRMHFPSRTASFIVAFLMALAFQPVRRYVQRLVDLRFFKSVYDYRQILREAGSALASVRDRDQLVSTLVNALNRALHTRGVAVFLPGHEEELLRISSHGCEELPHSMREADPVLIFARQTDDVLVVDELIRRPGIFAEVGHRLRAWDISIAIPLIAGGRIDGMVFLGEKTSGDVFTVDDIGLLRILGKQAAIALDNARHFHEMVLLNEYHERLLHVMQDGVIALDPTERIITFNPAAERITGVPASQVLGKSLTDTGVTTLTIRDTGDQTVETVLTNREGDEVPVLVTVTPFLRRWDIAESHLIVFRDLSTLRALEQEKVQAERFSSMGAMAASLAHEIKNPLVPIQMFAHLLPSKYDDEEFRKEFSVTVVNEVERINRLVGQMLDLVRKPASDRGTVNLLEVIERLLVLIRPDCERQDVTVNLQAGEHIPVLVGVVGQLYQAVLNVLMNAVQAMPAGGTLHISLCTAADDLICTISDTGPGVAAEDLPRIFEPLFSTKTGGHGLGLALTYQFIRSHGGEIRAECAPGSGLTVVITLPITHHAEAELLCS